MQTSPLISVIITTYNREKLLIQAIESVFAQSYPNYEVIVVDDGSTDETQQYFVDLNRPVQYLRLKHTGHPSVGRNTALACAKGEFVAFLDDDDIWLSDKLAAQMEIFRANPEFGFVYGDMQFLFADGSISPPVLNNNQKLSGNIFSDLLADCFIYPSTVMVRKNLIDCVGGFDETFNIVEDYDFWIRLASKAKAGFLDNPLVWIRRHEDGISHQRKLDIQLNVIAMFEKLKKHTPLTFSQRLRVHRSQARRWTHAGMILQQRGQGDEARSFFVRSVRCNMFQRTAWVELVKSYVSGVLLCI